MSPHPYVADRDAHPNHKGERPCKDCPLPKANRVHELPDVHDEQAEHRRRIGDDR